MNSEQRLAFIQSCERAGFTVETEEFRKGGVLIVSIRDGYSYIVRVMNTRRFDFEEAARKFYEWQQRGGNRHNTKKAA